MAQVTRLYDAQTFLIQDWDCDACRGGKAAAEASATSDVVFVRRGVFAYHQGRDETVLDPNRLLFITSGREYQISHPAENGDVCTVLSIHPSLISQALSATHSAGSLDESTPFASASGYAEARHFHAHWRMLRLLKEQAPRLEIEQAVYGLVFQAFRGTTPVPPPTATTAKAHRELANDAMYILNASLDQQVGLEDVARRVGASPFHLCRVFKSETGVGLGEYCTQLRLRAAVHDMLHQHTSVSAVAARYGFSSASYFVSRFRLATGLTPSQYVKAIRPTHSSGRAMMFDAH